ncbi:Hpt domain-containing protein, partial [Oleiphilus sp. HI0061]
MLSGNETRVVHKTMSPATSKSSAEEQTGSEATETQSASEPALPSDSLEPETESSPETNNEAAAEAEQEEDIQDSWDDDEDDLIDDEILEIFIEEAGEVLEAIDTHLPTYLAAHDDQDSLTELRRAFHTLKGSGRMVNANIIGEAAWAIENLLNRIIDGSVMMNESIAELIQLVVDNIPKLIECFEKRQRPDFDLKRVENHAAALVAGDFVKPLGSLQRSSQE